MQGAHQKGGPKDSQKRLSFLGLWKTLQRETGVACGKLCKKVKKVGTNLLTTVSKCAIIEVS